MTSRNSRRCSVSECQLEGDVFTDRLAPEWPRMRGVEITEEEFREQERAQRERGT